MKTPRILIAILFGTGFSVAAVLALGATWTPEQKELIAVMDDWQKAYDRGDADKLGQLLADEIDFTSRSLKGTFKDKASLLEAYKQWFVAHKSKFSVPDQYITYLDVKIAGDEASVSRKIDWTQRGERGLQSGSVTKTSYLKRLNGKWKIYSEK
jgi:ketosteroid isomerase-like protein